MPRRQFWSVVTDPRVIASCKLTFGASLVAAAINAIGGFILAWVLVRYEFPGKKILDTLLDLPLVLPTAVAGIALAFLYSDNGWIGSLLAPRNIHLAFSPAGIVLALMFVTSPFVVRTVQP